MKIEFLTKPNGKNQYIFAQKLSSLLAKPSNCQYLNDQTY